MEKISTIFGATIDKNCPLPRHPNPYFERTNFLSLNGYWEFSMTRRYERPENYSDKILVPFSVETPLSEINLPVTAQDYMHYRKVLVAPDSYVGKGALLHFDAVDQVADVYLNGQKVLHHEGGYLPFVVAIAVLKKKTVIEVVAHDDLSSIVFARGKQSLSPKGIWYHSTSGIWQSVYLESVPTDGYISAIKIMPDYDAKLVRIHADFMGLTSYPSAQAFFDGQMVAKDNFDENGNVTLDLHYDFFPWSPDFPNLYTLRLSDGADIVTSLFAFRKVSIVKKGCRHFLLLNEKPTFVSALLDQGYYPESGLTPPSEAAMANDIMIAKKSGFNCLRKHIKIEPMRWYYLCDKLGMLVSQDFVNSGGKYSEFLIDVRPFISFPMSDHNNNILGRRNDESRQRFIDDMRDTVNYLYNVSSIIIWTIFNEGWGQFMAVKMTSILRQLDASRLIDSTSGWYDKKVGDFSSHHVYFRYPHLHNDHRRLLALTEFGGYSLAVKNHVFSSRSVGYRFFSSFDDYNEAVKKLYCDHIMRLIRKEALSVAVYTQLTDVEEEVNGLVTYDRKITKIDNYDMRSINKQLLALYAEEYKKSH